MLYIFAGESRKASVKDLLHKMWPDKVPNTAPPRFVELDILRNKAHDMSKKANQLVIFQQIAARDWDVVLVSPPCNTWTRAVWSNYNGPKPMRSFDYPMGFPWLPWRTKQTCMLANTLAIFAIEVLDKQLSVGGHVLLEQPEDLGTIRSGPHAGQRPASMWQLPQLKQLLQNTNIEYACLRQSDFGTSYLKPTRLLFTLPGVNSDHRFFKGPPSFDPKGYYVGPCPASSSSGASLIGKKGSAFATTGTAAWPPLLCEWIATSICTVATTKPVSDVLSQRGRPVRSLQTGSTSGAANGDSGSTSCTAPLELITVIQRVPGYRGTGAPSSPVQPVSTSCTASPPEARATSFISSSPGSLGPKLHSAEYAASKLRRFSRMGIMKEYHDGAGLTSQGRFNLADRIFPPWPDLRTTLEEVADWHLGGVAGVDRWAFRLATGSLTELFPQKAIEDCRFVMAGWLKQKGVSVKGDPLEIAPGQPFLLKLIGGFLCAANDPEKDLPLDLARGVTAGILHPMPRSPVVYEEQRRWRLEQDPLASHVHYAGNYASVAEHSDWARAHMEEEVAAGRMIKLTKDQLKQRYGNNVAVASLAVLVSKGGIKKRLIHDGTHKVGVNHKIRCLNRQRLPGVHEKFFLMRHYADNHVPLFSVVTDVSMAHRRIKIGEDEWGMLGCQCDEADEHVYLNTVGTFGISSASEWWQRHFATIVRITHNLLGHANPLDLLLYSDDLEAVAPGARGRRSIVLALLYMCAVGVPFQITKVRGGVEVDWIGLRCCYISMRLGLSPLRAAWLADWCDDIVRRGRAHTRELAAGLGRLGFAAMALYWERPLLGPMYAWVSTILRNAVPTVIIPWAIRLILTWIARRLREGDHLQSPPKVLKQLGELFRTDARAEGGRCWIGGWETFTTTDVGEARWFAAEVLPSWFPWPWQKANDTQRVIAALELLGSIVAIKVFSDRWEHGAAAGCSVTGATDNRGNSFAVTKMMSTKWPLTVLIVELSEELRALGLELFLTWVPRDSNEEADRLSNMDTTGFCPSRRVVVGPDTLSWKVLDSWMPAATEMFQRMLADRDSRPSLPVPPCRAGARPKRGVDTLGAW